MREAPCDEGCWSFGEVTMESDSLVAEYAIVWKGSSQKKKQA